MVKVCTYVLLVFYISALMRPVMPVVNDAMAHTFWKVHHLATVHFENGKYHVHAEMQQAAKENTSDKKATAANAADLLAVHIGTEDAKTVFFRSSSIKKVLHHDDGLFFTSLKKDTPPPKV